MVDILFIKILYYISSIWSNITLQMCIKKKEKKELDEMWQRNVMSNYWPRLSMISWIIKAKVWVLC